MNEWTFILRNLLLKICRFYTLIKKCYSNSFCSKTGTSFLDIVAILILTGTDLDNDGLPESDPVTVARYDIVGSNGDVKDSDPKFYIYNSKY